MATPIRLKIEPLGKQHDRAAFSCGNESLNEYLKRRAGQDSRNNLARVYVAVGDTPEAVAGFYTLSTLGVHLDQLPEALAAKLPRYPELPAALIGRLAVDLNHQGQGIGELLLVDAIKRVVVSAQKIGIYAILVEAKDEAAVSFYRKYEFVLFPDQADRLFLPIKTAARLFE